MDSGGVVKTMIMTDDISQWYIVNIWHASFAHEPNELICLVIN